MCLLHSMRGEATKTEETRNRNNDADNDDDHDDTSLNALTGLRQSCH